MRRQALLDACGAMLRSSWQRYRLNPASFTWIAWGLQGIHLALRSESEAGMSWASPDPSVVTSLLRGIGALLEQLVACPRPEVRSEVARTLRAFSSLVPLPENLRGCLAGLSSDARPASGEQPWSVPVPESVILLMPCTLAGPRRPSPNARPSGLPNLSPPPTFVQAPDLALRTTESGLRPRHSILRPPPSAASCTISASPTRVQCWQLLLRQQLSSLPPCRWCNSAPRPILGPNHPILVRSFSFCSNAGPTN